MEQSSDDDIGEDTEEASTEEKDDCGPRWDRTLQMLLLLLLVVVVMIHFAAVATHILAPHRPTMIARTPTRNCRFVFSLLFLTGITVIL